MEKQVLEQFNNNKQDDYDQFEFRGSYDNSNYKEESAQDEVNSDCNEQVKDRNEDKVASDHEVKTNSHR